jgi:hypothetical protein
MTDSGNQTDYSGSDLLRGAAAIGRAINKKKEQVYPIARKGELPIGRDGRGLIASAAELRRAYAAKINTAK